MFKVNRRRSGVFIVKSDPTNIYLLKVNNRKTRKRCKIFLKLRIKNNEFEHILYFFISSVSNVNFEQVNVSWGTCFTLFSSTSVVEFGK